MSEVPLNGGRDLTGPSPGASLTSLLTSDDTRGAHSFLESDQILNLLPDGRGLGTSQLAALDKKLDFKKKKK